MQVRVFLVFTDLDGTLLDAETYSFDAARPALDRLRSKGIPLVMVSSKTRAEIEVWRSRIGNKDPFISENGGAIFVPDGYFHFAICASRERDGYHVIEMGTSYPILVEALQRASHETACRVAAFHSMDANEVAGLCALPLDEAVLAKTREYDEAFQILDDERGPALLAALERAGFQWTRGGRFHHVLRGSDKARAVQQLRDLYGRKYADLRTVGLGDAPNDASFLNVVDIAVLIRSDNTERLQELVPRGRATPLEGPGGWNQAVLALI
jgi:mannosyl-3-phosphoglycerate phosphatase